MYRRIEELAEGKVHTELPVLAFSTEQVRLEPVEGTVTAGSFLVTCMSQVPVKGIVYSTDIRMEIKNPQFQGTEAEIRYEFHGEHLVEGEVATGKFFIICNGGEYDLSWSVAVKRLYAETSIGRISGMDDFIRLYRVNWRESVHVFAAPAFKKLVKNVNERLYYSLLSNKPVSRSNMEEFLIACGRKERVRFRFSAHEAEHLLLSEPVEESFTILLSTWGYTALTVSSDADFVVPEKELLTTDDFNGDHMELHYRIYPERMHAGKNYARLTVQNLLQQESYEITATRREVLDLERDDRRRLAAENLRLLRAYEQYRAGELVEGEWAKLTTTLLRTRRENGEHTDMDALWCAYAFICDRRMQEAAWIMDEYRRSREAGTDREWAFFLYLCTLTEKEQKLLDRLYENIRDIYRSSHEDPWMRFLIIEIADRSPEVLGKQLKLMEQWFSQGLHSPFLYARAAEIYQQEPYLLLKLGDFELHVLYWMCRHMRLCRGLAEQVVRRAVSVRVYEKLLDRILEICYQTYPIEEILAGVCAYRMKGQRYDQATHAWYELAIEHDLQLTGLYEAYMASLDPREIRQLPRKVQLYFQYTNHLSYRQKAVLYVNIIANREEQPAVYERYRPIIQEFAEQEILAGHMDDNLAVVYAHALEHLALTPELAHALANILYMNKFTCLEEPVTHVIVCHENLRLPKICPVVEHQAYIPVYPGNYVIMLQDAHGVRYALSSDAQLERLMNAGRYIRKCLEQAPQELSYVLHHMSGKTRMLHMDEQMAGYVRTLVRSDEVSDAYKSRISPGFLEYCKGEGFAGDIRDYVLKIDFKTLDRSDKDRYLESLIQLKMYTEAWEFLILYGIGHLPVQALQQIVLEELQAQQMQEEEHLLYVTLQCFLMGCMKRPVIEYLCSHYQGPTTRMVSIWREAVAQQIPAGELEERMLVQMMFTGAFTPDVQKVFASYRSHEGRAQVCMAYLTYISYEVFVHQMVAEPEFYISLEQATLGNRRANEYLRQALLLHYSTLEFLTAEQERFVDEMLDDGIAKGELYAFFLSFGARQLVRHHLYDVCVVEYRSAVADSTVWLNYRVRSGGSEFERRQLTPVCGSIYLWHTHLVGGEQLEYYISETSERMETITESRVAEAPEYENLPENRYVRLGQMIRCVQEDDAAALRAQMEQYQVYDSLSARLFRVL